VRLQELIHVPEHRVATPHLPSWGTLSWVLFGDGQHGTTQLQGYLLTYIFVCFSVGIACLGVTIVTAKRKGDPLALAFLVFYLSVSLLRSTSRPAVRGRMPTSILIERWRIEYNTFRPDSALGARPPTPESWQPVPIEPPILEAALHG
jgi:hypothetical protein